MKKIFLLLVLIQTSASPNPEPLAKPPQQKIHPETPPPMSSKLAKLQEAEATRQLAEEARNKTEAKLDAARTAKARAKQEHAALTEEITIMHLPDYQGGRSHDTVQVELETAKSALTRAAKAKEEAMKDFVDESTWLKKSEDKVLSIKTDENKVFRVGRELGEKTKGYANIATIAGVPVSLAAAGVGAAALAYKFSGDDTTPTQEAIAQSASDINVEEVDAPSAP